MGRRARPPSTCMAEALDAFVIDGVEHNIPFLAALMQHPRWREGRALDRLHRRGIQGRLQAARAEGRGVAAAGRGRHRHRPPDQRAPAPDHRPDGRPAGALRQPPHRHGRHRARRGAGGGNAGRADQGDVRRQGQAPRHPRAAIGLVAGPARLDRHGARQARVRAGAPDPQRLRPRLTAASAPRPASTPSGRPHLPR